MFVSIILSITGIYLRFYLYNKIQRIDLYAFFKTIIFRIIVVTLVNLLMYLITIRFFIVSNISEFLLYSTVYVVLNFLVIFMFGLDINEKNIIINKIKALI